ncbi:MAG: T9SS type A sorting domain-containing protein [Weeksellaceae bacterium]|nr:T9SS type A sorting domain-containing protein [Weeksellaceae bacterium]
MTWRLLYAMMLLGVFATAQPYDFQSSMQTYVPLENATSVTQGNIWINVEATIPIGFDFAIGQHVVQDLRLTEYAGAIAPVFGLGTATDVGMVSAYGALVADRNATDNNEGQPGGVSDILYKTEGAEGNRIFTLEYRNVGLHIEWMVNGTSDMFTNFQVKLYENGSRIEYVYGPTNVTSNFQVFLGQTGPAVVIAPRYDVSDPNNPLLIEGYHLVGNHAAPQLVPIVSEDDLLTGVQGVPQNGRTYIFTNNMKVDDVYGVKDWAVFPNPAGDMLEHNYVLEDVAKMYVVDAAGKLIRSEIPIAKINLKGLTTGVYYLQLELLNGERVSKRFLKK